ncbi:glycosyltransferase [Pedobacter yonginense]|uniref:Glycosyltransferase n=1 Tax=Pedobacter yonginense TaxID=651869 RepID=A0A317EKN3_9SPHI|nr:glycosyltransferase family 2 protein [Pedobacter yonginense]PWS26403.1 glycosyltransferase [Pedobacter yonginense]
MKRQVICITPVKNEAWILPTFLKAASLWADHIILSDQGSTDNSVAIAKSFDKVTLIENLGKEYNESERQAQLLAEARKIDGENNIFIALDADELLVNYHNNPEWESLKAEEPGTTIWLPWLNVLPDFEHYYASTGGEMLFGYINDNREHKGNTIHSPRVPSDLTEKRVVFKNLKILHFQYAFKERLWSKHRWYECFEKLKHPLKNNIDLYRQYHHIDLPIKKIEKMNPLWLERMQENQIYITNIKDDGNYWWDKQVCLWFDDYGVKHFKKIAIWNVNWASIYYNTLHRDATHIKDPRSWLDKLVHRWLATSQADRFAFHNKLINKLLRAINW